MGAIGKLISTKIENYVTAIVQKKLGQNVEESFFSPSGDDSPPLPDDIIYMAEKDGKGRMSFLGALMLSQGAEAGEKKLYSRDSSGLVQAVIYLKKNGVIELNGNADFAVSHTDLNAALQGLVLAINARFATKLDGVGTIGNLTLDLSGSKVNDVRLP